MRRNRAAGLVAGNRRRTADRDRARRFKSGAGRFVRFENQVPLDFDRFRDKRARRRFGTGNRRGAVNRQGTADIKRGAVERFVVLRNQIAQYDQVVFGVQRAAVSGRFIAFERNGQGRFARRVRRESNRRFRPGVNRAAVPVRRFVADEGDRDEGRVDERVNRAADFRDVVRKGRVFDGKRSGLRGDRAARERRAADERRVLDDEFALREDRAAEFGREVVLERTAVDGQRSDVVDRAAETGRQFAAGRGSGQTDVVVREVDVVQGQFAAVDDRAADRARAASRRQAGNRRDRAFLNEEDSGRVRAVDGNVAVFAVDDDVLRDFNRAGRRVDGNRFALHRLGEGNGRFDRFRQARDAVDHLNLRTVVQGQLVAVNFVAGLQRSDREVREFERTAVGVIDDRTVFKDERAVRVFVVLQVSKFDVRVFERGAVGQDNLFAVREDQRLIRVAVAFARVQVRAVDEGNVLIRIELEVRRGAVREGNFAARNVGALGPVFHRVREVTAVELRAVVNRTTVEEELVAVLEVDQNAVLFDDVDLDRQRAVFDRNDLTVFEDVLRSVGDHKDRDVFVSARVRDRFAERSQTVGRVDDVLFRRNDGARGFEDIERSGVNVVVFARETVFFAVFDDLADAVDVERQRDRVTTGRKRAQVGGQRRGTVRGDPVAFVQPIETVEGTRVVANILRLRVNDFALVVRSNERHRITEVRVNRRVANILDVEVDANVLTGDEVVEFDRRAVFEFFRLPVIDRRIDEIEVRRDNRGVFEGAHIDRHNDAADRQTDATVVTGQVDERAAVESVRTVVDRRGRNRQRVIAVFRVDELRIDAEERTVSRVEVERLVAVLRDVAEERGAERRRRAFDGVNVEALRGGVGRFISGENRIVDVSRSGVVEPGAVGGFVVGDRRVRQVRGSDVVNRAAETGRDVLRDQGVRNGKGSGRVDRGAVARFRTFDFDAGQFQRSGRVERAADRSGVSGEERSDDRRGSFVVKGAAFVGRRVSDERALVDRRVSDVVNRAADGRGDVREIGVGEPERSVRVVVNRAAVQSRRSVEGRVRNIGGSGVVNSAAARRGRTAVELRIVDDERSDVVNDAVSERAGRVERRVLNRRGTGVINRRAVASGVAGEGRVRNRQGRAGRVVNRAADAARERFVAGEFDGVDRQRSLVVNDAAVLRRRRVRQLEVLDFNFRAGFNGEEARVDALNRQVEKVAVRIDAVEREGGRQRQFALRQDERLSVERRVENDGVRFARDLLNDRDAGLVGVGFAFPKDRRPGVDLAGDVFALEDERVAASVVLDFVTVGEGNDDAVGQVVAVVAGVDVSAFDERQFDAVDDDFRAFGHRVFDGRRNDEDALGRVVNRAFAVGERNGRPVQNDGDVVRGDATENAVDDGDFGSVGEEEVADRLHRVAIVSRLRDVRPNAVDHFDRDAVDFALRSVRNGDRFIVRVEVNVFGVNDRNDRFAIQRRFDDVGRGEGVIGARPSARGFVPLRVDVFDAADRKGRLVAVGQRDDVPFGVDVSALLGVPNERFGDRFGKRERFARVNAVVGRIVDVELAVLDRIGNAARFEGRAFRQGDFAIVEAARVNFDRFAQRNLAVVSVDDVFGRRNDDRVVDRNRRLDDVEIGRGQVEVVRFGVFVERGAGVELVPEDVVSLFVLRFERAVGDETLDNLFDRTERDVRQRDKAVRAVVFDRLDGAGRKVRQRDRRDRGTVAARHRNAVGEVDFDVHQREFVVSELRIGEHLLFRRGLRIVLPHIDRRFEGLLNRGALVDERQVQEEVFVDEERRDGTGLVVFGAGNHDGAFPVVDDVGTGGARDEFRQVGRTENFVSAGVDGSAFKARLPGEVGLVIFGEEVTVLVPTVVTVRNALAEVEVVRQVVGISAVDGGRVALQTEVPRLPEFARPIGDVVTAIADELRIVSRNRRGNAAAARRPDKRRAADVRRARPVFIRGVVRVAGFVADNGVRGARRFPRLRVNVGAVGRFVFRDDRVVKVDDAGVLNTAAGVVRRVPGDRNVNQRRDGARFVVETAADRVFFRNDIADDRRVDEVEPTVVLVLIFVFAAGVVDTAARFQGAVPGDHAVADREPTVVVVDTAAVVRLAVFTVGFGLFLSGVERAVVNGVALRDGGVALFADEIGERSGGDGNVILPDRAVVRVTVRRRIAEAGRRNANVIRVARGQTVRFEVREEGVGRVAGIKEVPGVVVKFDDEVEVRVTEARGVTGGVGAIVIGAGTDDVDHIRRIGRDEREHIGVACAFDQTVGDEVSAADVRFAQSGGVRALVGIIVGFVTETGGDVREVVLRLRRALVFALAELRQRLIVPGAHNRGPTVRSAVIFVAAVAVVREVKRVPDFVRNRFGDVFRRTEGVREDVAVLLLRAERIQVGDAAAVVSGSADHNANRVRGGVEDVLVGRNGNVERRVVFGDAEVDFVDRFEFGVVEGRRVAVEVVSRVRFAAPARAVDPAEVEVNNVRRFRDAAGEGETVKLDGRVVDVHHAEFFVRVDRNARTVVFGVPSERRVEYEAFFAKRLIDERTRESEAERFAQVERLAGEGRVEGQRVPQVARTVFETTTAVHERFLPVQHVVDGGRVFERLDVHFFRVDIEVFVTFVHRQGVLPQGAVVGEAVRRVVPLPDAGNANVIRLARFEFRRNEVREGRERGIVDRLVPFFERTVGVVDLFAELVDHVVIVVVRQDDRFAVAELLNLAVHIEENDFAVLVEKFDLDVQVRVIVSRGVIFTGEDGVFDVAVADVIPAEITVDEAMVGPGAGNVDDVGSAVRNEREHIVVVAVANNAAHRIRPGGRVVGINVDRDVVVVEFRRRVDRVAEIVVSESDAGRDDRDVVLHIRGVDVGTVAPLGDRRAVAGPHNRAPEAVSAVVFVVFVTVVAQAHRVADFVRGGFGDVLSRQTERERIDVVVLLARSEAADVGETARRRAVTADNATDAVRRVRPNVRVGRNVDVERRVVFRDASPNLLDEFQFGNAVTARTVEVERRVREAVPTGSVRAREVQVNNVFGVARHTFERKRFGFGNRSFGQFRSIRNPRFWLQRRLGSRLILLQPREADDFRREGIVSAVFVTAVIRETFRQRASALNRALIVQVSVRRDRQTPRRTGTFEQVRVVRVLFALAAFVAVVRQRVRDRILVVRVFVVVVRNFVLNGRFRRVRANKTDVVRRTVVLERVRVIVVPPNGDVFANLASVVGTSRNNFGGNGVSFAKSAKHIVDHRVARRNVTADLREVDIHKEAAALDLVRAAREVRAHAVFVVAVEEIVEDLRAGEGTADVEITGTEVFGDRVFDRFEVTDGSVRLRHRGREPGFLRPTGVRHHVRDGADPTGGSV